MNSTGKICAISVDTRLVNGSIECIMMIFILDFEKSYEHGWGADHFSLVVTDVKILKLINF